MKLIYTILASVIFSFFLPVFGEAASTEVIETCDSYTDPTGTIYENSGIYSYTVTDTQGMDSTVTFELIVHPSYTDLLYMDICAGSGISSDTIMVFNLTSVNGCDSTVIFNIHVLPISEVYFYESACEFYTTPNGDTYYESGIYTIILSDQFGCDSIINFELEITDIQNAVSILGNSLVATETDAVYQWIDCDNDYSPIDGATSQSYTPESSGNYAVIIEKDNCTKTSNCIFFENLIGEEEDKFFNNIAVYPNPSDGSVQVTTGDSGSSYLIRVLNTFGQELELINVAPGIQKTELNIDSPSGIYFIEVANQSGGKKVIRLLKN